MKSVNPYTVPRARMVLEQLAAKGVRDEWVARQPSGAASPVDRIVAGSIQVF